MSDAQPLSNRIVIDDMNDELIVDGKRINGAALSWLTEQRTKPSRWFRLLPGPVDQIVVETRAPD